MKLPKNNRRTLRMAMNNNLLESKIVDLESIYLDPNNPRFNDDNHIEVEESRIIESSIQALTLEKMKKDYDVDSLESTIEKMGFLKINRVVVRELEAHPNCFVVVEGNRRISACKSLKQQFDKGRAIEPKILESINNIEVLIYKGKDRNISWEIQGVNHLTGLRAWPPFNQAYHLVQKMENEDLSAKNAAKMFGLKANDVIKMVRAYYALQKLKDDDEYGERAENSLYSYFEEVFKKPDVKNWLSWDDSSREFTNKPNLSKFYSWFLPNSEERKQLPMAIDIRKLPPILRDTRALDEFDNGRSLDSVLQTLVSRNDIKTYNEIMTDLAQATANIRNIPVGEFYDHKDEIKIELQNIIKACDDIIKRA
jgi:rhodanese-related sulfurtransferase